uniref:Uncharacterized protein n=1 Tax=Rhizophagus irregularis (strain DAOM 181602 / DAOM 197198 / MUCL 43194) TaxID=747089 RepID=U9SXP9_RHIID
MARKQPSRNNRHQTKGLYTTNPTQYIPLTNFNKYKHIFDGIHIVVVNKHTRDPKGLRPIGHAKKLIFRLNAAHKSDMINVFVVEQRDKVPALLIQR